GIRHAAKAPDAVVMDVVLPDLSGFDAARRIRSMDASLPVIFITAHGTSETAIEAMKVGAFDYLPKPLDIPRLRQLVDRAVRARHAPATIARPATAPGAGARPSPRFPPNGSGLRGLGDLGTLIPLGGASPPSDLRPFLERQLRRQSQSI